MKWSFFPKLLLIFESVIDIAQISKEMSHNYISKAILPNNFIDSTNSNRRSEVHKNLSSLLIGTIPWSVKAHCPSYLFFIVIVEAHCFEGLPLIWKIHITVAFDSFWLEIMGGNGSLSISEQSKMQLTVW